MSTGDLYHDRADECEHEGVGKACENCRAAWSLEDALVLAGLQGFFSVVTPTMKPWGRINEYGRVNGTAMRAAVRRIKSLTTMRGEESPVEVTTRLVTPLQAERIREEALSYGESPLGRVMRQYRRKVAEATARGNILQIGEVVEHPDGRITMEVWEVPRR